MLTFGAHGSFPAVPKDKCRRLGFGLGDNLQNPEYIFVRVTHKMKAGELAQCIGE